MTDSRTPIDRDALLGIALDWLQLADAADHEQTWQQASQLFRTAVAQDDWRVLLRAARAPVGELEARTNRSVEPLVEPPGAPDGHYAKLEFDSRFAHKRAATETISLIEEPDGAWRVSGYFLT